MIHQTSRSIARIAIGAMVAGLVGLWQGHPFVFIAVYGLGVAIWQARQEARFVRWLTDGGDNNLTGWWSQVAQLVTDRQNREQEQNLRGATELAVFRDLSANFPDGIVMLDKAWRIMWFNNAAIDHLGLARGDMGQRIVNLIRHPDFADSLKQADAQLVIESPVDSTRALSLQAVDVAQNRRILIVKDITEHQSLEAMRHDFVANASHELRSPLTVIRGYLDALASDGELDGVWEKPINEMLRQATRMSDLLTDLMDLSRLDRLHSKAKMEPIEVAALAAQVSNEYQELAGPDSIITCNADSNYELLGERAEVLSALSNLVANAVRYSRDNCQVSISWTVDAQGGHLAVRDNGIGIPEEEIPRITERFYRVDKGRSRQSGGTGLGLSIVRNTLSRHDGRLEIQSKLGKGSVFICHFPAKRIARAAGDVLATG